MKLAQMFPDFNSMSEEEKTQFVRNYRERRAIELSNIEVKTRKPRSSSIQLSEQDKALLAKYGISMKRLASLDMSAEEEEDSGSFAVDDTFDLESEEES